VSLEHYLTTRAIPVDLARLYFEEARYRIDDQGGAREYRALAFANDAGGYELRSPSFKGTLGTKATRFIPATTLRPDAAVFEGAMDFVSALAYYGRERSDGNVLVLNSTALVEKGLERLQAEGLHTALTYFDHDEAGRLATRRFEDEGARYGVRIVRDMASIYEGYGDFNEFLVARSEQGKRRRDADRER